MKRQPPDLAAMENNVIETKNANLSTLSVTIQALHVSGKQMTLAVFKQLPERQISDDAQPWGTVRYGIKDEGDLWLVFSREGILYRTGRPSAYREWAEVKAIKAGIAGVRKKILDGEAAIADLLKNQNSEMATAAKARSDLRSGRFVADILEGRNHGRLLWAIEELEKWEQGGRPEPRDAVARRAETEKARVELPNLVAALEKATATATQEQRLVDLWGQWAKDTPQLFIAV